MQNDYEGQKLVLNDRSDFSLTGVENVESFDEETVFVKTNQGFCRIVGEELKIAKLNLDEGIISLTGRIDAMLYDEEQTQGASEGFFSKLFK